MTQPWERDWSKPSAAPWERDWSRPAPVDPAQPEAEDPGALMSAVIGAGRTGDKLWQGLKQAVLGVPAMMGSESAKQSLADMAAQQKSADEVYDKLAEKRPVATMIGEAAPLVAAPMLASGVGGAALSAAVPGLVSYGTAGEKLQQGAMGAAGGALGALAGKGVSALLQPTRNAAARAPEAALAAAKRMGYTPTAGQESGARALQLLEQQAAKNPISAGTAQKFNLRNQQAVNRAAAQAIGESGDSITEDMMAAAAKRLGGEFEGAFAGTTIPVKESVGKYADLMAKSAKNAGEFADPQIVSLAERAAAVAERGAITGEEYQAMRSALTTIKREAAARGAGQVKASAMGIIKALDDAAEKVVPPEQMAAFAKTRAQYAAMKTLEKKGAIKGGNVDPAIVRNVLQSGDRSAFARGAIPGEMADIAAIGNAFRPLPDSGTAGNTVAQLLLSGGAGLLGPQALATTVAAPWLGGKALFSDAGRRYLTRGLMDVSPELERRLMQSGAGLLGLPAIVAAGRQ